MDTFTITHLNMKDKLIFYKINHSPDTVTTSLLWTQTSYFRMRNGAIQLTGIRRLQLKDRKLAKRINARLRSLSSSGFAPMRLVEADIEL